MGSDPVGSLPYGSSSILHPFPVQVMQTLTTEPSLCLIEKGVIWKMPNKIIIHYLTLSRVLWQKSHDRHDFGVEHQRYWHFSTRAFFTATVRRNFSLEATDRGSYIEETRIALWSEIHMLRLWNDAASFNWSRQRLLYRQALLLGFNTQLPR